MYGEADDDTTNHEREQVADPAFGRRQAVEKRRNRRERASGNERGRERIEPGRRVLGALVEDQMHTRPARPGKCAKV